MRNRRCADRATSWSPAALLRVSVRVPRSACARAHRLAVRRCFYDGARSACTGRGPQPPAATRCPLSALAAVVRAPQRAGHARLSHVQARPPHRAGYRVNAAPKLSVVVAVQHSKANLPDILDALEPGAHPDVEFIFCHSATHAPRRSGIGEGNAAELYGGPDALIPHLWRDGIRAAMGTWVATTTAHCIPAPDWVARLKGHVDDPP